MDFFLYYSVLVGLMATWVATRKWIRKAPEIGLVCRDMNKLEKPQVPEMGGLYRHRGASKAFSMLAGYNGLMVGFGVIILLMLKYEGLLWNYL
ncbi:MAG: Glycosyl transferase, family 4 [Methanothrix harundinacea]|jgi:UDP-N-acetylmuramyl pentapeptide phosphotransferase/UDP-N-acetylglucosamine-1-phosphate transferase|uniref:Glycosyl transferase, family 4 n=1 Tax=Methanothrix harundinacea TaxID=301375 RepID=A0A101FSC2_9EURY|nr:MAG: Glycosyl transferase, family 4 [Methanothrix harundinacea]